MGLVILTESNQDLLQSMKPKTVASYQSGLTQRPQKPSHQERLRWYHPGRFSLKKHSYLQFTTEKIPEISQTVKRKASVYGSDAAQGALSNIRVHKRMHRFTLRSKYKVDVQWTRTRFALVHNIGKIHVFGALI